MTQEKTQLSETLTHQRLEYETLKAKADTYCHHTGDRVFETASHPGAGPYFSDDPLNEEIELELLQRKEALQKGTPS